MLEGKDFTMPGWVAVVLFVGIVVSTLYGGSGESFLCRCLGVACLALAAVFIFPPFYQLKKYGQVRRGAPYMDTTVVVDKGLYAIVRHPQYVGYILLFFGFVLLSQSGVTLVLAALGIFAMVTLAMQEERDCLEHFGGSYAAYRQRVPPFNFLLGVIQYLRRTFDGKEGLSSNGPSSP